MALSNDQKRRVRESLTETMEWLERWTHRITFDDKQEAEKQNQIAWYKAHAAKLQAMLEE